MHENLEVEGKAKKIGIFTQNADYRRAMEAMATKITPQNPPHVLTLASITRMDREDFRRAMWARRRREWIDEQSRQCREMRAKRPVDYASLPLRKRPIRRVKRSEAARARRREGWEHLERAEGTAGEAQGAGLERTDSVV
ncbi:hypothetical protein R3P38DRAFT_2770125 [Favolaschia claudopus]|uniref:Uncharacterized protein n=1 Tax=Favolaschia claudopus TaxID=2862362 RepID=A0AAW0CLX5_9AGAR